MMDDLLKVELRNAEMCTAWINELVRSDMAWHFDDSPETIIHGPTGERLFKTEEECDKARLLVASCFALLDDPHDTMIHAQHLRDDEVDDECAMCGDRATLDELYDELTTDNAIGFYLHCGRCTEEIKSGEAGEVSPREYARLEFGYTKRGLQVWCIRHDRNVVHIDFEGHKHPAV